MHILIEWTGGKTFKLGFFFVQRRRWSCRKGHRSCSYFLVGFCDPLRVLFHVQTVCFSVIDVGAFQPRRWADGTIVLSRVAPLLRSLRSTHQDELTKVGTAGVRWKGIILWAYWMMKMHSMRNAQRAPIALIMLLDLEYAIYRRPFSTCYVII